MKKVFAIMAVGGLFLASCKGDYHCHCTTAAGEVEQDYENVKKADAETSCESYAVLIQQGDPSATCELEEGEH